MNLEIGVKYFTRNGSSVILSHNTNIDGFDFSIRPLIGTVTMIDGCKKSATFTIEGKYYGHIDHCLDIINEYSHGK